MAHRRILKVDASTALAAALFIGVQAILMSVSLGVHAAPGQRDAFGARICAFNNGSDQGGRPAEGHLLPDCCAAGCALASGSPVPAPSLLVLPGISAPVAYPLPETGLQPETDRSSIRSRGPPSLA